jgi:DegV family protein with EDD domain
VSVCIITDSTADLSPQVARERQITLIPLKIYFGQEVFRDGVDLTRDQFYDRLAASESLPTTSQIPPVQFLEAMQPIVARGDEVVLLTISSQLSGTFQSACLARDMLPADQQQRVYICDSRQVAYALGSMALYAARLRDEGKSGRRIFDALESVKNRMRIFFIAGDLKYLYLGGRLTRTGMTVGNALNVRPVLQVKDGQITIATLVRGQRKGCQWMAQQVKRLGVDPTIPTTLIHTHIPELLPVMHAAMDAQFGPAQYDEAELGTVVGTHVGPECAGVSFLMAP